MTEDELNALSEKIIGCAYTVGNKLGCGFLEKVYENALAYEIRKLGFLVEPQKPLAVRYDDVVQGSVIVELKTANGFADNHKAQCINYLHAVRLPLCLLINFGRPRVEIKRIFESQYLGNLL